jgi:hypothetical protein
MTIESVDCCDVSARLLKRSMASSKKIRPISKEKLDSALRTPPVNPLNKLDSSPIYYTLKPPKIRSVGTNLMIHEAFLTPIKIGSKIERHYLLNGLSP